MLPHGSAADGRHHDGSGSAKRIAGTRDYAAKGQSDRGSGQAAYSELHLPVAAVRTADAPTDLCLRGC